VTIRDPIAEGLAAGWKVHDASTLDRDLQLDCDVAVVGTGAGGGVTAEILAEAGLDVVLLEEGPLRSSRDFHMLESEAYPQLYQESAARKTRDKAIGILQGRCVGGSTTVNWTTSFRTPSSTLAHWRDRLELRDLTEAALAPWFERMERRLAIAPWQPAPNANNDALRMGALRLGIETGRIARNVSGCWDLGYCGTGCPTNAKQSMLVTTIPAALNTGARLIVRARVERLKFAGERVAGLEAHALDTSGLRPTAYRVRVHARHTVLAGGAIGSPAILLRSLAPDPHAVLGRRTFLHPTVISAAIMRGAVNGYAGAPQSVYSDHFLQRDPIDGALGFKLEVPPLHPLLFGMTLPGFGAGHAALMQQFAQAQVLIALLRDGFHRDSPGGRVVLRGDDSPVLDYPFTDALRNGMRRALLAMAEIQFAAGATRVIAVHEQITGYESWQQARAAIAQLPLEPLLTRVVSAHVMGGCGMSADPRRGVVDSYGRHWQLAGLSVHDGSVFPTSLGANPQLSIYALTARNASRLAVTLGKQPAAALA
jgi:choline dehydrogenase-like flavoprotein